MKTQATAQMTKPRLPITIEDIENRLHGAIEPIDLHGHGSQTFDGSIDGATQADDADTGCDGTIVLDAISAANRVTLAYAADEVVSAMRETGANEETTVLLENLFVRPRTRPFTFDFLLEARRKLLGVDLRCDASYAAAMLIRAACKHGYHDPSSDLLLRVHEYDDDIALNPKVMPSGIDALDQITGGLINGEHTVVAAPPKSCALALLQQIVRSVAVDRGVESLCVLTRMTALELGDRLLCSLAKVSGSRLTAR